MIQPWIAGGLLLVGAALILDLALLKKRRKIPDSMTRFVVDIVGGGICIVVGLLLL